GVVREQVRPDIELLRADPLLAGRDGAGDELRLDRLPLLPPEALHDPLDPLGAEDAEQIVLEREVEPRRAGVPLPARPAAQLVVDPARLVALGADDVEPADADDPLVLGIGDLLRLLPGGLPRLRRCRA